MIRKALTNRATMLALMRAGSRLLTYGQPTDISVCTLEEAEREHVLRALRESNWVVGGADGAAARLGMKRTTLAYRIRKLRIPCRPE